MRFLHYLGLLCLTLVGFTFCDTINGQIGQVYIEYINAKNSFTLLFSKDDLSSEHPARVHVRKGDASYGDEPVFVVLRQERDVISWELPYQAENGQLYSFASHTTCPYANESLEVIVSTSDEWPVRVEVYVSLQTSYKISLNTSIQTHAEPTSPRYFRFDFPENVTSVLLEVISPNDSCTTLSLFKSCSIHQLVEFSTHRDNYRQTITKKGGMMINQKMFPKGHFYVGFVVLSDDQKCLDGFISQPSVNASIIDEPVRMKNLTLTITDISEVSIVLLLAETMGFLLLMTVFLVFVWMSLKCWIAFRKRRINQGDPFQRLAEIRRRSDDLVALLSGLGEDLTESSDQIYECSEIRKLKAMENLKKQIRAGDTIYLSHVIWHTLEDWKYSQSLYPWILAAIIIYNCIPVIYMVIVYQSNIHKTGDLDWCYYNFFCSHPLMFLSDFNHVASNIGYGYLGLFFNLLVKRREKAAINEPLINHFKGIPPLFNLYYSMGWALFAECVCSSCYHVCPNKFNFQIDTCFMYVIAVMCGIKLYQNRHPSGAMRAKNAFFFLAVLSVISWLGELLDNYLATWIVFSAVYMTISFFCCIHVYYCGCWRFRLPSRTLFHEVRADAFRKDRFIYTSLIFLLNLTLCISGLALRPKDIAFCLLIVLVANLALCTAIYLVMKCVVDGSLWFCRPKPVILLVASVICWTLAMICFGETSTTWEEPAAVSRTFNQKCVLLEFFDYHDLWHLLSSCGLFFYFWLLLIIDDDIKDMCRSQIKVIL
ncbi:SID1 transmembrane family member 1-like [Neocloeon triangulifer]|uniref:SID1 transmembrane family member 1-like n=1 Tax=Neocloeon triangulifer TaxID=2078957 RepID=UPI00286F56B7|nr:SID1 transmembrane family member 1-like [Neocloeon triangulifer]